MRPFEKISILLPKPQPDCVKSRDSGSVYCDGPAKHMTGSDNCVGRFWSERLRT